MSLRLLVIGVVLVMLLVSIQLEVGVGHDIDSSVGGCCQCMDTATSTNSNINNMILTLGVLQALVLTGFHFVQSCSHSLQPHEAGVCTDFLTVWVQAVLLGSDIHAGVHDPDRLGCYF